MHKKEKKITRWNKKEKKKIIEKEHRKEKIRKEKTNKKRLNEKTENILTKFNIPEQIPFQAS